MTTDSIVTELNKILHTAVQAETADGSYAGEFTHLDKLLMILGIHGGYVVDIAAADGYTQSSTLGFFKREAWAGLAVEMDPRRFATLAFIYSAFPNARLARARVTPINVKSLLEGHEVPKDFDLLNLDIDSYDLYVIEAMLKSEFRPKVISMEINEKIPPPLFFTVDYDESHYWMMDHFFGCSIQAAAATVKPYGYILQNLIYNNAIFVRTDIALDHVADMDTNTAYVNGYQNAPNKQVLFPWNKDVDCWLDNDPEKTFNLVKEYFSKYEGKFTLKI
jgi:hypothetical protein